MNRKTIIGIGVVLVILGTVLMILLNDYKYGNIIGGLVIGAGGGCLSVLVAPKKEK